MQWMCRECGVNYPANIKAKPYGLCEGCYFRPEVHKKHREAAKFGIGPCGPDDPGERGVPGNTVSPPVIPPPDVDACVSVGHADDRVGADPVKPDLLDQHMEHLLSWGGMPAHLTGVLDPEGKRRKILMERLCQIEKCDKDAYVAVLPKLDRWLNCPTCMLSIPVRRFINTPRYCFVWKDFEFHGYCPDCCYEGAFVRKDLANPREFSVIELPRYELEFWESHVIWKIPSGLAGSIRMGAPLALENVYWDIINAVKRDRELALNDWVIGPVQAVIDPCWKGWSPAGQGDKSLGFAFWRGRQGHEKAD